MAQKENVFSKQLLAQVNISLRKETAQLELNQEHVDCQQMFCHWANSFFIQYLRLELGYKASAFWLFGLCDFFSQRQAEGGNKNKNKIPQECQL